MTTNSNRINKNTSNNWGNKSEKELFLLARPVWQGWRDSNPRPSVLETDALAN